MDDTYIVICRADNTDGNEGVYVLATRQVFDAPEMATHYASTIASSREPMVVTGRWNELRTFRNAQERLHDLAKKLERKHEGIARFLHIQAEDRCQALAMTETIDIGGGDEAFLRRYDVEV